MGRLALGRQGRTRRALERVRARLRDNSKLKLPNRFASIDSRLARVEEHLGDQNRIDLDASLGRIAARIEDIVAALDQREGQWRSWQEHVSATLRFVADEEAENRRRVWELRDDPGYAEPFDLDEPLVSIPIPTYQGFAELRDRALPSALAQTYSNIEILVVGDGAPPETARVVGEMGDPRIRYFNLAHRGPYPSEPEMLWHVAGIMPLNEGIRRSRGDWIAPLNDDDTFSPDHVERLVAAARDARAEVAYGKLVRHTPGGATELLGRFPPERAQFGWQMAVFHRGLRFFGYQFAAAALNEPGDWNLCRRMLNAGVRFTMIPDVVGDYYPSKLWKPEQ